MNNKIPAAAPQQFRVGDKVQFTDFYAYQRWYTRQHPQFVFVQRDEILTVKWIEDDMIGVAGVSWGAGIPLHFLEPIL